MAPHTHTHIYMYRTVFRGHMSAGQRRSVLQEPAAYSGLGLSNSSQGRRVDCAVSHGPQNTVQWPLPLAHNTERGLTGAEGGRGEGVTLIIEVTGEHERRDRTDREIERESD